MKKVKIPAQLYKPILEEAFQRDVVQNSISGEHKDDLGTDLIGVITHKTGERLVYQLLKVENERKSYISSLASPTHLFFNTALEMYELSEKRMNENFPSCAKSSPDDIIQFLDFDPRGTHEYFNDYLQAKMTSLIMLVCTLESFINLKIPAEFSYENRKGKLLTLIEIEKKVPLIEKLELLIPQIVNEPNFWLDLKNMLCELKSMVRLRNEIIHLKTKGREEWQRYFDVYSELIKTNLENSIKFTVNLMNLVEPNFIEFE